MPSIRIFCGILTFIPTRCLARIMFLTWMKNKLKYNFNAVSLGNNYSRFFVGEHFVVFRVSQTLLKQKRIFFVGIHT